MKVQAVDNMTTYLVPFDTGYIVYRPLIPMAFVINAPMAELIGQWLRGEVVSEHNKVWQWLDDLGFWQPDLPLDKFIASDPQAPTTAVLLMTNLCNLRCTYCYADAGAQSENMLSETQGKALISAAEKNAQQTGQTKFNLVFHGGGEPTSNWNTLRKLVSFARSRSLPAHLSMATNAAFTGDRLEFIIENFDELSVSFDGLPELQNSQRPTAGGSDSSARVIRNLKRLDSIQFPYGLRMTVSEEYFSRIPEAVKFISREFNCKGVQIEPAYSATRGDHGYGNASAGQIFANFFKQALDIGIERSCFVYYSGATPWRVTDKFCRAATDALIGTPDGDLVGCFEIHDRQHARSDDYRLGKFHARDANPQSLIATSSGRVTPIVFDPNLQQNFQQRELNRKSTCESCFCYYHCAGDCSIHRADAGTTDSPRCEVNRDITGDILLRMIADSGGVWRGQYAVAKEIC